MGIPPTRSCPDREREKDLLHVLVCFPMATTVAGRGVEKVLALAELSSLDLP